MIDIVATHLTATNGNDVTFTVRTWENSSLLITVLLFKSDSNLQEKAIKEFIVS